MVWCRRWGHRDTVISPLRPTLQSVWKVARASARRDLTLSWPVAVRTHSVGGNRRSPKARALPWVDVPLPTYLPKSFIYIKHMDIYVYVCFHFYLRLSLSLSFFLFLSLSLSLSLSLLYDFFIEILKYDQTWFAQLPK